MHLGMKRVIHRAHVKKLESRQIEDGTGIVHRWLQENYADSMLIGLRRILDDSKGTYSLIKLLRKLENHRASFAWEHYLRLWPDAQPPADDVYPRALYATFSRDGLTIDRQRIRADATKLLTDHKRIREYINTAVAHQSAADANATTPVTSITWEDLDRLFDEVAALFNKYYGLIRPGVHVDFAPVLPSGLERAFERMLEKSDG
jgi:hypothetical protein